MATQLGMASAATQPVNPLQLAAAQGTLAVGTLVTNFNRLALYLAHKAGLVAWGQLPLTTQVQCIKAGATATLATWHVAPQHAAWCAGAIAATGGAAVY